MSVSMKWVTEKTKRNTYKQTGNGVIQTNMIMLENEIFSFELHIAIYFFKLHLAIYCVGISSGC